MCAETNRPTEPSKLPRVVKLDDDTVLEEIIFTENKTNTPTSATEQALLLGLLCVTITSCKMSDMLKQSFVFVDIATNECAKVKVTSFEKKSKRIQT